MNYATKYSQRIVFSCKINPFTFIEKEKKQLYFRNYLRILAKKKKCKSFSHENRRMRTRNMIYYFF